MGASQSSIRVVSTFRAQEELSDVYSGGPSTSILHQMSSSQYTRFDNARPPQPGPVHSVSIFGERRVEPPRVSDRCHNASLLSQLMTNQHCRSSSTNTSQRGLGVVDDGSQLPPSDLDNRVASASCRVVISSTDRSAAEAASTPPAPQNNPPAHSSGQREDDRGNATPPRMGRPPGSN